MEGFQPLLLDRNGIAHKEEAIKKEHPYTKLFDDLGNQVYVARIETQLNGNCLSLSSEHLSTHSFSDGKQPVVLDSCKIEFRKFSPPTIP